MQSNMYSRLETSPSLFLALLGIFEARFFSRAPRIPVNPDIRESRYSSEAQKGLVSSLNVIQDGCSVCAHDDIVVSEQKSLKSIFVILRKLHLKNLFKCDYLCEKKP